jgi:hypothetical protein
VVGSVLLLSVICVGALFFYKRNQRAAAKQRLQMRRSSLAIAQNVGAQVNTWRRASLANMAETMDGGTLPVPAWQAEDDEFVEEGEELDMTEVDHVEGMFAEHEMDMDEPEGDVPYHSNGNGPPPISADEGEDMDVGEYPPEQHGYAIQSYQEEADDQYYPPQQPPRQPPYQQSYAQGEQRGYSHNAAADASMAAMTADAWSQHHHDRQGQESPSIERADSCLSDADRSVEEVHDESHLFDQDHYTPEVARRASGFAVLPREAAAAVGVGAVAAGMGMGMGRAQSSKQMAASTRHLAHPIPDLSPAATSNPLRTASSTQKMASKRNLAYAVPDVVPEATAIPMPSMRRLPSSMQVPDAAAPPMQRLSSSKQFPDAAAESVAPVPEADAATMAARTGSVKRMPTRRQPVQALRTNSSSSPATAVSDAFIYGQPAHPTGDAKHGVPSNHQAEGVSEPPADAIAVSIPSSSWDETPSTSTTGVKVPMLKLRSTLNISARLPTESSSSVPLAPAPAPARTPTHASMPPIEAVDADAADLAVDMLLSSLAISHNIAPAGPLPSHADRDARPQAEEGGVGPSPGITNSTFGKPLASRTSSFHMRSNNLKDDAESRAAAPVTTTTTMSSGNGTGSAQSEEQIPPTSVSPAPLAHGGRRLSSLARVAVLGISAQNASTREPSPAATGGPSRLKSLSIDMSDAVPTATRPPSVNGVGDVGITKLRRSSLLHMRSMVPDAKPQLGLSSADLKSALQNASGPSAGIASVRPRRASAELMLERPPSAMVLPTETPHASSPGWFKFGENRRARNLPPVIPADEDTGAEEIFPGRVSMMESRRSFAAPSPVFRSPSAYYPNKDAMLEALQGPLGKANRKA